MVIYVDVLIFQGTLVTYFLLLSVCAAFKNRPRTLRIICGSLVGGVSSLIIFLPPLHFLVGILVRAGICALVVFVTFPLKGWVRFLKYAGAFLAVSYVYAGGMLALWFLLRPPGMALGNTAVYFNISPLMLIGCTVVSYVIIRLAAHFRNNSVSERLIYDCTVKTESGVFSFSALCDTGNTLKDPFFGYPVVVVADSVIGKSIPQKTFVIPYNALSGAGVLRAFCPVWLEVAVGEKRLKCSEIVVAVSEQEIHTEYHGLISPEIINISKERFDEVVFKD